MATWRDTTDHDLGDENDRSEFAVAFDDAVKCPFCDDTFDFSASYVTPVLSHTKRYRFVDGHSISYVHKQIEDRIITCDAPSCLKIAGDLAKKWEARLK